MFDTIYHFFRCWPICYSFQNSYLQTRSKPRKSMTPLQSVQRFTSNSSYCFHVNFFWIGTCVRIPVQTCLIRLKLIALSNVALFSLVWAPSHQCMRSNQIDIQTVQIYKAIQIIFIRAVTQADVTLTGSTSLSFSLILLPLRRYYPH